MKRLILLIVTLATTATQLFAAHLCPLDGPRGGRTGKSRRIRNGRPAERNRAGGRHGNRRRRALRAESRPRRIHALDSVSRIRPREEAGARGAGEPPGRFRDARLGDRHPERGGKGPAGAARSRPVRGRRGERPGGHRQRRHRAAGTRPRRMDRRGEDFDQRQERLEGLRQRPRAAHGAGTAADLPAVAPGRGDSENRGRAHHGSRLRRRLGGRHHPHHAQKTPRERRRRLGVVQHLAGHNHSPIRSVGQH